MRIIQGVLISGPVKGQVESRLQIQRRFGFVLLQRDRDRRHSLLQRPSIDRRAAPSPATPHQGVVVARGQFALHRQPLAAAQEAGVDLSFGSSRQQRAVHVLRPSHHRVTGINIFAHCVFHKARRGNHFDLARLNILLGNDSFYSGPVIAVAMGIDNGNNGLYPQVIIYKAHSRPGGINGCKRVYYNISFFSDDDPHVGKVIPAYLINAVINFKKPMQVVECCLPLQAGINRVMRAVFFEKIVLSHIPDYAVLGIADKSGRDPRY